MVSGNNRVWERIVAASLFATCAQIAAAPVRAEAVIRGDLQSVELEAKDATIDEILAALSAKLKINYRTSGGLNRRISGTYRGSLAGGVSRMLNGYNFVMESSGDTLDVLVLDTASPGARPAAARTADASPPAPPTTPATTDPTPPIDVATLFGRDAPPLKVPEAFIRAYAKRAMRGNSPNRFRRDF